jgi:molybdopterin-guanine dinucleotide biosynthesis protein MobB
MIADGPPLKQLRGEGPGPPVICIVGRKNSGKTELTVALAGELNRRSHRVMTVKSGHGFQLDQPGRDSWRHRHEGGAFRTVLAGPGDFAVIGNWPEGEMSLSELARRFLWDADVVLAEGFKKAPEPKIQVFRAATDSGPLFDPEGPSGTNTVALVTDAPAFEAAVPVFSLVEPDCIAALADLVEGLMGGGRIDS